MVVVKEVKTEHQFGDKPYLTFDHVTMVPMCQRLIDTALLTTDEVQWINDYHEEVESKTKSFFEGDERTLKWLHRETRPLATD